MPAAERRNIIQSKLILVDLLELKILYYISDHFCERYEDFCDQPASVPKIESSDVKSRGESRKKKGARAGMMERLKEIERKIEWRDREERKRNVIIKGVEKGRKKKRSCGEGFGNHKGQGRG